VPQTLLALRLTGADRARAVVQDVARELEITERAVYSACKHLKEILDACTDAELIAKAIRRGMLTGS
jgi:DNA-binding CsgD family transcriptional regulator